MKLSISDRIFDLLPDFCRGVVVAWGVNNQGQNPGLEAELRMAEEGTRTDPVRRDFKRLPRITAWLQAFEKMGVSLKEASPSVVQLMKRVTSGGRLPFISPLVTVFNIQSIDSLVPCGGDDLNAVSGDLVLRLATGEERYTPLGKPDQVERPCPGEIIYCDGVGQVLCRRLCWRNGHPSRIQPTTSRVLINVDGLPPVGVDEVRRIAEELGGRVVKSCGGNVKTFLLSRSCREVDVEISRT